MAGFLGALEYALEEGPSKDWFESGPVTIAIVVSAVSGVAFFWRMATRRQPIVDLSAFRDRNFWTGSMFAFVMGIGLYGLTYIYPVYLAVVRGYSPLMIGKTMFVTGVCMFLTAPIAGRLMTLVDPRLMIATGFVGFAVGTWLASYITVDWDFWELLWPQMFRGVGLMLSMVPINNLALGTMPPQKIKNASGLFNLTRNLGGAVGLALINTVLDKRMDLHLERLRESVDLGTRGGRRNHGEHDGGAGGARVGRRARGDPPDRDDRSSAGRGDGARGRVSGAHLRVPGLRRPRRVDAPPGRRGSGRRRPLNEG